VLARTKSECETSESESESVFVKGPNVTLTVGTNQTTSFPRALTGSGGALFHTESSNEPVVVDGSFAVAFNKAETVASNVAGETLDAALARLVAYVESLGYTE
jgi:hypothetical protein